MRSLLIATIILLPGLAAAQQKAPGTDPAALTGICNGFLAESAGGVSGDHTKLCACLVRETPAQLTATEMSAYAEATLANKAPPPAVTQKMTAIATKCLTESAK